MQEKLFLCIVLFFSFFIDVNSQTSTLDSIHLEKFSFYRNINLDSAIFYCEKLKNAASICKRLEAITGESYVYYKQKKYKKAEKNLKDLLIKVDSLQKTVSLHCFDDRKIAIHNRLFWIKKNQENYNSAYKHLLKCEALILNSPVKDEKNFRDQLGIVLNKAVIKNKLNMHEEAKELLKKGIAKTKNPILNTVQEDPFFVQLKANISNCLGNTFFSLAAKKQNTSFLDSASYFYGKAYHISKSFIPQHKDSKIIYTFKKVKVLIAKKEYQEALNLINDYKQISNGYNYQHVSYLQKALCYYNLKKSDSAIFYATNFLNNKEKKIERSNLITIYDILSNEYHNLNQLDSAYKYSKLTMKHYELAEKNKGDTFQLLYENNFEEAKKLNQQIKKQENRKQNNSYGIFVILLIFIFSFMLLYSKNKQKKKQLIIDDLKDKASEKETLKKEYNISTELETQILNEIIKIATELQFLDADFSINTIAENSNTNSTYVSFIFNKHYQESFKQYYTKARIDYAVEKLKNDTTFRKYSIQGIGEEVGYTNASAFTRAFKKQIGITPSVFLKSLEH